MKTKMLWILLILLALICAVLFLFRSNYVISLLPLCFAVISLRKLQIAEERRSEKKAASLIARIAPGRIRKLRIENKGKGEARSIKVLLDDKPLDEQHPLWYERQPQVTTELSGRKHRDYILYLRPSALPKIAEIHWDDDAKKGNVKVCPVPY